MKELDLMQAINDLDNGILLEAEQVELKPRRRLLTRIAAVAAALALLCGTVYAVSQGVRAAFTGETWVSHHEQLREDMRYSDLEVNYDLAQREIPEEAVAFLEGYVEEAWVRMKADYPGWIVFDRSFLAGTVWDWEQFLEEDETLQVTEGPAPHYFDSISQAEEFFGLTFAVPDAIRQAELTTVSEEDGGKVHLRVLTPPLVEDPASVGPYLAMWDSEEIPGYIVPGYAELNFGVAAPTEDFSSISGTIYLALSEEAAEEGFTSFLSIALDYLSEPEFRELEIDGLDGTLLVFDPCDTDDGGVYAFYTCGGVGYTIHACLAEGVGTEDPAELLMPWLEELG